MYILLCAILFNSVCVWIMEYTFPCHLVEYANGMSSSIVGYTPPLLACTHCGSNSQFFLLSKVLLTPNSEWGGEGSLGCGIGYGYLHRIPARGSQQPPKELPPQVSITPEKGHVSPPPPSYMTTTLIPVAEGFADVSDGEERVAGVNDGEEGLAGVSEGRRGLLV